MNGNHVVSTVAMAAMLGVLAPVAAGARGPAIVVGFHCVPASDDGSLPLPATPGDLVPSAPEPGAYDVWLFIHTRAPLIGAWTLTTALTLIADGTASDIEVLEWSGFSDAFRPFDGWPASGTGFRAEWRRERCWQPDRYMVSGRDGWWIQPVLKLRVLARGPARITLTDPEPGVRPQMTECADEMHELDGSDNWTLVLPAVFGEAESQPSIPSVLPSAPVTWGRLKCCPGNRQ